MTTPGIELWIDACFLGRLARLAQDQGRRIDVRDIGTRHGLRGEAVPLAVVEAVAREAGFTARHRVVSWSGLADVPLPALLVFRDHSTAILDAVETISAQARPDHPDHPDHIVIREDGPDTSPPLTLDCDDLAPLWDGHLLVLSPL